MSRFDPDKYINYQKLAENLKVVRDRYACSLSHNNYYFWSFLNFNALLIQPYFSLLFTLSDCSNLWPWPRRSPTVTLMTPKVRTSSVGSPTCSFGPTEWPCRTPPHRWLCYSSSLVDYQRWICVAVDYLSHRITRSLKIFKLMAKRNIINLEKVLCCRPCLRSLSIKFLSWSAYAHPSTIAGNHTLNVYNCIPIHSSLHSLRSRLLFPLQSTVTTWSRPSLEPATTSREPRRQTRRSMTSSPPLPPSMEWASGNLAVESYTRW